MAYLNFQRRLGSKGWKAYASLYEHNKIIRYIGDISTKEGKERLTAACREFNFLPGPAVCKRNRLFAWLGRYYQDTPVRSRRAPTTYKKKRKGVK